MYSCFASLLHGIFFDLCLFINETVANCFLGVFINVQDPTEIISFEISTTRLQLTEYIKFMNYLDSTRGTNWKTTFPEVSELISKNSHLKD